MGLEPAELARWTRFAAKGGIGKCTATCDCVAESSDDLMFLKDDEITVLLQIQDKEGCYLGYCEGVVGRFSGSDVLFHSKLKKPIMAKRASTNTPLSGIPYSSTPPTPTTPTSPENLVFRSSSRRLAEELLTVTGGGRSPSQNSLGQISPSGSTASSPIPAGPRQASSIVGARSTSQDTRKAGALQYGAMSPREFHHGITDEEALVEALPSPKVELSLDELTRLSNGIILTSPSTPPPVPPAMEPVQLSSPNGKVDAPASLKPPGALTNDHDTTTPTSTAPLRIIKRPSSNPSSPARSFFSPPATGSLEHSNESSSIPPDTPHVFDDMTHKTGLPMSPPPSSLDLMSMEIDRKDQVSALPSSFDTSLTTESALDDQFLRFSMGRTFSIPQSFGLTSENTSQPTSSKSKEPQSSPTTNSPPTFPSNIDGRTSLSIAARGKVDEAVLASTQAQVGIGLSLLQDLVGGMSSDSNSDSEYDDSDEEASTEEATKLVRGQAYAPKGPENGPANSTRSRVIPSEGDTDQGLTYADEEDIPRISSTKNSSYNNSPLASAMHSSTSLPLRSPPTTPPTRYQSPRSLSRYAQPQSPDSFTLPEALVRERRPSVAQSVVSGASGLSRKSGASSSWDGDIYDNYRYSTFSVGSSMAGVRRPSMDSVRPRADSVSVAGRRRLDSISPIQDVAEEAETAGPTGTENQSSQPTDADASFYSRDSRLSTLSSVVTSLAASGLPSDNRPSPLSIVEDHSPLLHTDWASPFSPPASSVQTGLPPPTASVYTAQVRENDATDALKVGVLVVSQVADSGTKAEEQQATGMASTMRKRFEAECQPPLSNETSLSDVALDLSNVSFSSSGFGEAIVVDDNDELPSRFLSDGDASDLYDNDDIVLEPQEEGSRADSLELKDNDSIRDRTPVPASPSPRTSFGHLAPLIVCNRTPSPAMLANGDEGDTHANSDSTQPEGSNLPPPLYPAHAQPFRQSPPPSRPQQPLEPNVARQRPSHNNSLGQERRSLFLPHPNAPKAPANAPLNLQPGAGVGAVSPVDSRSGGVPFASPSHAWPPVQVVIRMALSMPPRTTPSGPGKSPVLILPTVYGRTEYDLATSDRPVPIMFSVDPPPPPPNAGGRKATAPNGAYLPRIGAGGSNVNGLVVPGPVNSPPRRPSTSPARTGLGPALPVSSSVVPNIASPVVHLPSSLTPEVKDKPTTDTKVEKTEKTVGVTDSKAPAPKKPIPRPNFTPKTPGIRPRSRSFSGFNSSESRATPPLKGGEKPSIVNWPKRSSTSAAPVPLALKRLAKPSRPSPLSVSAVNSADDSSKSPSSPVVTSPLARNVFIPQRAPSPSPAPSSITGIMDRPSPSRPALADGPHVGITDVRSTHVSANETLSTNSFGRKPSLEGATREASLAGTGVARQSSLRSKLSLPNLRRNRTREEDTGIYDRDANERRLERSKEMMQVQDMEFELVRPNISLLQAQPRRSEDSMVGRADNVSETRVDNGLLRSESPAVSFSSSDLRSPVVEMRNSVNGTGGFNNDASVALIGQSSESIEAHRQRETKWVSLMSSSPASLSRKSKKVKKMLVDGVPSSVRYLIWSYLTDGKGRAVRGVYEQLCQRGGGFRTRDIVADAERLFGGDKGSNGVQYLQATKGAVIVLLQAYFSMVPDIQYSTGLTKIVGQLLLLAPEEDAFWIFTSIMDTHIRPYFTVTAPAPSSAAIPRSTQMEVDAALFSRALESIDAPLAKKIFVDLGILPGALCHPWFTSLFVGTLPPECVNRVWDVFLYEGIPFLLRVALCLTIICRKFILSSRANSESAVFAVLARPPHQWLPTAPEAFLTLAFGVKLKDDDIRKQRLKMGEQVKRQTQAQQALSSVISSGISLPSFSRV